MSADPAADPIPRVPVGDPLAQSVDGAAENLAKLRALFPEVVAEGARGPAVDVDALAALIGKQPVEDGQTDERFGLHWHGKAVARRLALTPTGGTLRPKRGDGVDWDATGNLVIEGDNLEVLKLLRKTLAGRVKLIYIDPPYNTGKDFVYKDDYRDGVRHYQRLTGQRGENGERLTTNAEGGGRFHTRWLNMMLPRVKLARELLTKDGAIFASCDEGEQPRLRALMDEVFGQENFVADMVWAAGRKNDSRLISISHEYIVCYARDAAELKERKIEWRQRKKGLDDIYAQHAKLKRKHGDDYDSITAGMKHWYKGLADGHPAKDHKHFAHADRRGIYFPDNISWPGGGGPKYEVLHPETKKPVKVPSRGWFTSRPERMQELIDDNRVHFGETEDRVPCIKSHLSDKEEVTPYSVFYQDGRAASKRLRELMNGDVFDFPKDETVLQEVFGMMTDGDDIIMDAFAGSGTTGHAVMAQNAADGGNRRYVLVQLPEPLDPDNKATKAAAAYCDKLGVPRTLAELTKERLRRAAAKVREDHPDAAFDGGFRVYALDTSNVRAWDPDPRDLEADLLTAIDQVREGRTEADLLAEILLKRGLFDPVAYPVETRTAAGKTVHCVGHGTLFVCVAEELDRDGGEAVAVCIRDWAAELDPAGGAAVVLRDGAFAGAGGDVVKVNMAQTLRQAGLTNVRSI